MRISNQSTRFNLWNEDFFYYGDSTVFTLVGILTIVMLVIIFGNSLVLATITFNKDMRTPTNLLLASLAVSDIIVGVVCIPFAITTLINGTWPFSEILCIANAFIVGVSLMVSAHLLMWISVHKYIAITRPFTKISHRHILLMIALAWGWCIFYNLTPLMGWTDIIYRRGASQCGPTTPTEIFQRLHGLTHLVFNHILPLSITTYCYIHIFNEIRKHKKRLEKSSDVNEKRLIVEYRQIAVTFCIILACFYLCTTPMLVWCYLLIFWGNEYVSEILNPITYLCIYMNSAFNPIIYAMRLPSFRKGFMELIYFHSKTEQSISISNMESKQGITMVCDPILAMKNNKPLKISSNKRSRLNSFAELILRRNKQGPVLADKTNNNENMDDKSYTNKSMNLN